MRLIKFHKICEFDFGLKDKGIAPNSPDLSSRSRLYSSAFLILLPIMRGDGNSDLEM